MLVALKQYIAGWPDGIAASSPAFDALLAALDSVIDEPLATQRLLNSVLRGDYARDIKLPLSLRKNVPPELRLLPSTDAQAQYLYIAREIIRRRLDKQWYEGKLVYINALKKSGSTALEPVIRDMLHARGVDAFYFPDFGSAGPLVAIGSESLNLGMLLHVPNGGVLRGCYAAHNENSRIQHLTRGKMCTVFRHPADRIVGNICMRYQLFSDKEQLSADHVIDAYLREDWAAIPGAYKAGNIYGLFGTLHWMSSWLLRGHKDPAYCFIRYEDMKTDIATPVQALHQWLFGVGAPPQIIENARDYWQRTAPGGDLQAIPSYGDHAYPRGHSGPVGIWKKYFTRAHVHTYNAIIDQYANICPNMGDLLEYYPDLRLDPAALETEWKEYA